MDPSGLLSDRALHAFIVFSETNPDFGAARADPLAQWFQEVGDFAILRVRAAEMPLVLVEDVPADGGSLVPFSVVVSTAADGTPDVHQSHVLAPGRRILHSNLLRAFLAALPLLLASSIDFVSNHSRV